MDEYFKKIELRGRLIVVAIACFYLLIATSVFYVITYVQGLNVLYVLAFIALIALLAFT